MEKKWFQIYTKSNCEKKLYKKIKQNELQVYLPSRIVKKKWSDRIKISEEPALKSYIFAKLTHEDMCLVKRLTGFCFFVTYGCPNKTIRDQKIRYPHISYSTIKLIALILMEYPDADWQESVEVIGCKVEFTNGSLKQYQGYLIDNSPISNVVIKLPGLKQVFIINVPNCLLKRVP